MKAVKKIKRSTKKPMFVVDATNIACPDDVAIQFIMAKTRSGIAVKDTDIAFAIMFGANIAINTINSFYSNGVAKYTELGNILKKATNAKKPWYKKIWNWIKKPFVKK